MMVLVGSLIYRETRMSYLSTISGSVCVPAECHQSESGCTGLSAPWRCGPSGLGRSLHTKKEQNRYTETEKGTSKKRKSETNPGERAGLLEVRFTIQETFSK